VFARFPRLGKVKSRLADRIGDDAALELYNALLSDSLRRYQRLPVDKRVLYFTGCSTGEAEQFLSSQDGLQGFQIAIQGEGDLGDRMWAAVEQSLNQSSGIVFVGSDSPTAPIPYLRRALHEVSEKTPIVVGPSRDGGYYLLGLSQSRPELFRHIPWGSNTVFLETLGRAPEKDVVLLPFWYDVDQWDDLCRLYQDMTRSPTSEYLTLRSTLSDQDGLRRELENSPQPVAGPRRLTP
jgi:rSAM/selenodomain-associated transferase 1